MVHSTKDRQQGALARAGLAHETGEVTLCNAKIDVTQNCYRLSASVVGVVLRHAVHGDEVGIAQARHSESPPKGPAWKLEVLGKACCRRRAMLLPSPQQLRSRSGCSRWPPFP